mmetsp:Transcript_101885/g.263311  ORF Transcript_101885/g.263311 Transcript_101885/m.263311 type:complete len:847 (-) Transcript_101885:110-2650(-)
MDASSAYCGHGGFAMLRGLVALLALAAAPCHGGMPPAYLEPRGDGSMRLMVGNRSSGCGQEIAPRGVALAVKGAPWIPIDTHFDREISLNHYDLEQLASAGVNLIRLGAMMPGVLPTPPVGGVYVHDARYVEKLKAFVEAAADHGMYTLIEFHQDVISPYYCGEGLPRWAADGVQADFADEFVDEVLELLHRLTIDVPGMYMLEDAALRGLIRNNVGRAQFPMPVAEPFEALSGQQRVYSLGDCEKYEWYQYQLSFAAGSAYRRLFNLQSSTFTHVLNYWKILAKAFKGNPNVLAFDLFNEPHPGNFLTEPWMMAPENAERRLAPFYKAIAQAIHSIDEDRLITFSPVTWEEGGYYLQEMNGPANQMCGWLREALLGLPLPGCETFWDVTRWMPESGIERSAFTEAPLPGQSILSFHFYTPPELNHEAYARKRKADAQKLQVYPLLSETCCVMDADALQRLYWFENAQIGWVMWEYKHMANGTWVGEHWVDDYGAMITGTGPDMFHRDGTPIKAHWRRLAHPSAQFVNGEVLANIFDFTVGTFNLTFIPAASCRHQDNDATIIWPWTWWAYINITSMPRIHVSPKGAAHVAELVQPSQAYTSPVLRFGVRVVNRPPPATRSTPITVTLSFVNFKNIDLLPEQPEPTVFGPWYQGLGWPVFLSSVLLLQGALLVCCCRRCCFPAQKYRDKPESRCMETHQPLSPKGSGAVASTTLPETSVADRETHKGVVPWNRWGLGSTPQSRAERAPLIEPPISALSQDGAEHENPEVTGREAEHLPLRQSPRLETPCMRSSPRRAAGCAPAGCAPMCLVEDRKDSIDGEDSERSWTTDILLAMGRASKEGNDGI